MVSSTVGYHLKLEVQSVRSVGWGGCGVKYTNSKTNHPPGNLASTVDLLVPSLQKH